METEKLMQFVDSLVEAAYQARCFTKESVQQVLTNAEVIKNKMLSADFLANANSELNVKIEVLESENKLLKNKFGVSDLDIENIKNENVINEIDVKDIEEISNHTPKIKKLNNG